MHWLQPDARALTYLGLAGWLTAAGWWRCYASYRLRHDVGRCCHELGRVISVDDNFGGAVYLVWVCDECHFQTNLHELQAVPGRDQFWYTRGAQVCGAEHAAAIVTARRSLDPGRKAQRRREPVRGGPSAR